MRVRRFKKGRLTVKRMNEIVDAINSNEIHSDGSLNLFRGPGGTVLRLFERNEAIPFINSGSNDCPAYGVLSLADVTLDTGMPFYLTADRPSTTFKRFQIVNGSEAVAAGETGVGYIVNGSHNRLCIAAYESGATPAGGEELGVKPGQFTLAEGYPSCFSVLGVLDSTNRWALGYLHPINELLVKTDSSHAKSASGNCSVYAGTTKGSESDIGITISIYNRFADLDADAWAIAKWVNGALELVAGECPA